MTRRCHQAKPATALHGPEVRTVGNPSPASPATPGVFTGTEILDALTDEKARTIVQKYGFDLRGLQVGGYRVTV